MLIVASAGIDLECFILPDGTSLGGTVPTVPAAVFAPRHRTGRTLLGNLVGGGTFLAVLAVFKRLRGVDAWGSATIKLMLTYSARPVRALGLP